METTYNLNAADCFDYAINAGVLSADPKASNFAGHYMYMGLQHADTDNAGLLFKHIDTRQYLPAVKYVSVVK